MSDRMKRLLAMLMFATGLSAAHADALSDAAAAIGRKDYAAAAGLLEPLAAAGDPRAPGTGAPRRDRP